MRVEIIDATFEHVVDLCENMRQREHTAFKKLGEAPEKLVTQELAKSLYTWTGLVDQKVVAIVGIRCVGVLSDEGYVWLIASELASFYPTTFLRRSLQHAEYMKTLFKKIHGYVHEDFDCSVKWLGWLGFEIEEATNGIRRFEWTRQA